MTSNPNMLLKLWQNRRSMLLVSVILTWCFSAFGHAQTMLNPTEPPVTSLQVAGIKLNIVKGQLIARATTQQGKGWKFGQNIQTIAATKDRVFALNAKGNLTALKTINGQQQWSIATGILIAPGGLLKLTVVPETIIVSALQPIGDVQPGRLASLIAFDLVKGTKLWRYLTEGPCQSNGVAVVYNGVVVWSFLCSDTYIYTDLRAFDFRSGKLLWEQQSSVSTDYGFAGKGLMYVINSMPADLQWDVFKINILTGKFTTRTVSIPLNYRPSCGMIEQTWDRRVERKFIVFSAEDRCGRFEHRIALW